MDRQYIAIEARVYLYYPRRAISLEELDIIIEGLISNLRQIANQMVPY